MLSSMGFRSAFEIESALSPHGYQSTGLCACWRRYGLVSLARRLVCLGFSGPVGFALVFSGPAVFGFSGLAAPAVCGFAAGSSARTDNEMARARKARNEK